MGEPTTIIGLVSLIVVQVGGVITLIIRQRGTRDKVIDVQKKVSDVHGQVQNDHGFSPNLREDVDELRADVKDVQRMNKIVISKIENLVDKDLPQLNRNIGRLGEDLSVERRDRQALAGQIERAHEDREKLKNRVKTYKDEHNEDVERLKAKIEECCQHKGEVGHVCNNDCKCDDDETKIRSEIDDEDEFE